MICVIEMVVNATVKLVCLTPNQFQFDGTRFESKLKKTYNGTQSAWNNFSKPAIDATAPVISVGGGGL